MQQLIRDAEPVKLEEQKKPSAIDEEKTCSIAKLANKEPFRNYKYVMQKVSETETKQVKKPVFLNLIVQDLFRRFWNFPCRLSTQLFDHDKKTKQIRFLKDKNELLTWIEQKSGHNIRWRSGEGFVTCDRLYMALINEAKEYNAISYTPMYPARDDVYYMVKDLPEATRNHDFFNKFCGFFSPASYNDSILLKVMNITSLL